MVPAVITFQFHHTLLQETFSQIFRTFRTRTGQGEDGMVDIIDFQRYIENEQVKDSLLSRVPIPELSTNGLAGINIHEIDVQAQQPEDNQFLIQVRVTLDRCIVLGQLIDETFLISRSHPDAPLKMNEPTEVTQLKNYLGLKIIRYQPVITK